MIARVFACVAALLLLVMPILDAGAHATPAGSPPRVSVLPTWLDVVDDASDHDQKQVPCESGQVHIPLAVALQHGCPLPPQSVTSGDWLRVDDVQPERGILLPNERPPSV